MLGLELKKLDAKYTNCNSKMVALLKAVGLEGRGFLHSAGFDIKYLLRALNLLDVHHGREEYLCTAAVKNNMYFLRIFM